MRFYARRIFRIAHHPYARLRTLDARYAMKAEAVLDRKAGAAELDLRLHRHVVSEAGGLEKTRTGARQRITGEVESLEQLKLGQPQRALEQRRCRGVEDFEIAWIENDPGGVAVAPFYAHLAGVAEGGHVIHLFCA